MKFGMVVSQVSMIEECRYFYAKINNSGIKLSNADLL